MPKQIPPAGPVPARIMIVGEAPGADEEARGEPFVGASGSELTRMLTEASISRSECFVTNVCRIRPPRNEIELFLRKPFSKAGKPTKEDEKKLREGIDPKKFVPLRNMLVHPAVKEGFELLKKEIQLVKPNIIITVGNTSMWALTGKWAITKWRGSMLKDDLGLEVKVLPTYHPAAILRQWDWRAVCVADLRRANRFKDGTPYPTPKWNFIIRPSYDQAIQTLDHLLHLAENGCDRLKLSHDIETRAGHIACIGISWSRTDAICIPLMSVSNVTGYWSLECEAGIIERLARLLTHRKVEVIGQNHTYDSQYTDRHFFFTPRLTCDTMIGQHALFSDMPKALHFISSLYCDYYVYWKDEGKNWDPKVGEDQLWYYNCEDCVYTYEVAEVEERLADTMGLREVFDFQQKMFWPVLQAMTRGVRIDLSRRNELIMEVQTEIDKRRGFLQEILGFELNPDSPKQMHTLFYEDFQLPVQMKRGKKGEPSKPTLEDDALQKLARIEPLLRPVINSISDIRTLGKFLSNFLCRPLDIDNRMRCSFNIGGSESGKSAPKTYRLSSSENAFGSGTNLQNIPSEKSKSLGKAAARAAFERLGDPYQFPNIREIFVPDSGYTWFDLDLERADLFVVCWEAEDDQLKAAMRMGVDIHLLNSFVITGKEPPPLEELVETHSKYRDHRGPMKLIREFAKVFCHGTNYGGQARTMAAHTGRTITEIERAQRIWFGAHPGILRWHDRVKKQVTSRRFIENRFGYRWYIFDRVESIIPEAIAWIPQSTVSIVINRIWERIFTNLPDVQVLLQVHDSLCGQFLSKCGVRTMVSALQGVSSILIPYDDPLIIPVSIKTSEKSWGHC